MKTALYIESEANARYKRWKKLAQDQKAIRKEQATLIEGVHLLESALQLKAPLSAVVLSEAAKAQARQWAQSAVAVGVPCYEVPARLFRALSPVENGLGVVSELNLAKWQPRQEELRGDVLYLDGVQDAGNAGTLIRSAVAAGFGTIVANVGTANLWSPKVLRAGMGAHFAAYIEEGVTPQAFRERFKGRILVADLKDADDLFEADDFTQTEVAWVMGAEGPGVSAAAKAIADQRFFIPFAGAVESLNVCAAGSICLFETLRRRRTHRT